MATDFDHYTEMDLDPIADHILVEDIESESERVHNNIIRLSEQGETRGIRPRWARVYLVGPEQIDVKVGEWILIEHGKWTRGIQLKNGNVIRKVDPEGLMMVADERPEDI